MSRNAVQQCLEVERCLVVGGDGGKRDLMVKVLRALEELCQSEGGDTSYLLLMLLPMSVARRDGVLPTRLMEALFTCVGETLQAERLISEFFDIFDPTQLQYTITESFANNIISFVAECNSRIMVPTVQFQSPPVIFNVSLLEMSLTIEENRVDCVNTVVQSVVDTLMLFGWVRAEQAVCASVAREVDKGWGNGSGEASDGKVLFAIVFHIFGTCLQHIKAKERIFNHVKLHYTRAKADAQTQQTNAKKWQWQKARDKLNGAQNLIGLCEDVEELLPGTNSFRTTAFQKPRVVRCGRDEICVGVGDFGLIQYAKDPLAVA